jgi:hypothetical protein
MSYHDRYAEQIYVQPVGSVAAPHSDDKAGVRVGAARGEAAPDGRL